MARGKKSKKKLLKEPDEFISTTTRILQFIGQHRRWVMIFICGVVSVSLICLFIRGHIKKMESEAKEVYSQAYQQFRDALDGFLLEEGSKERFESALKGFDRIIAEFPKTSSAIMAKLYRGHCLYQLGRYDEAIKAYEEFLSIRPKEMSITPYVMQSLALAYRAKGDFRESNRWFQKILEKEGGGAMRRSILLEIGRNHELLKETDQAIKVYEELLKEYPDDRSLNPVKDRISQLKGKASSSH
jgi:tetratricopeptide (TPR) repeat protein